METIISTQYYRNPRPAEFSTVSTELSTIHEGNEKEIKAGDEVTIYPNAPSGKRFVSWVVSGLESYDTQSVPLIFIMPNNDVSVGITYEDIPADPVIESATFSRNGTYTPPSGVDGYAPVEVNVQPVLTSLHVTENGIYYPQSWEDGFIRVTVNVSPNIESKTITENGTYTPPSGVDGFSPVTVNVSPNIESKTITENGTYNAPEGVDGFSPVIVNVPAGIENCVMYDLVVESDISARWVPVNEDGNAKIAQHYNDTNFAIYYKKLNQTTGSTGMSFVFISNTKFHEGSFNGVYVRHTASGANTSIFTNNFADKDTASSGHVVINENGVIELYAQATYGLRAGTYRVVCTW